MWLCVSSLLNSLVLDFSFDKFVDLTLVGLLPLHTMDAPRKRKSDNMFKDQIPLKKHSTLVYKFFLA